MIALITTTRFICLQAIRPLPSEDGFLSVKRAAVRGGFRSNGRHLCRRIGHGTLEHLQDGEAHHHGDLVGRVVRRLSCLVSDAALSACLFLARSSDAVLVLLIFGALQAGERAERHPPTS